MSSTLYDKIYQISEVFSDIKEAIESKDVIVPENTSVTEYSSLISTINNGNSGWMLLPEEEAVSLTQTTGMIVQRQIMPADTTASVLEQKNNVIEQVADLIVNTVDPTLQINEIVTESDGRKKYYIGHANSIAEIYLGSSSDYLYFGTMRSRSGNWLQIGCNDSNNNLASYGLYVRYKANADGDFYFAVKEVNNNFNIDTWYPTFGCGTYVDESGQECGKCIIYSFLRGNSMIIKLFADNDDFSIAFDHYHVSMNSYFPGSVDLSLYNFIINNDYKLKNFYWYTAVFGSAFGNMCHCLNNNDKTYMYINRGGSMPLFMQIV